ncbi:response regulator [Thalassococcus sp. CAU 1522]|uniref:Response regulator n=1 Tax=Thalassococcus arenae TaxID=2851652 RepID=A0ABS6N7V5_9RHOB|nr:response regulator [Thalassococcus arenae]MBV2359664.1 response regulator [Thalassococcus arenae]
MDDSDIFDTLPRPTATRPLLGMTVLVVEDSRYACDAMRLLCLRSGARIRRADCLRSARRHLQVYRPTAVVVDMGLPDGSGADLISELAGTTPRVPAIVGTSGDSFAEDVALAAGADVFLAKPITSVSVFQEAIIAALPADRQPSGVRLVSDDPIRPDPLAYRDDMAHAADVLGDYADDRIVRYVTQFISGVARSAGDVPLHEAAEDLAHAQARGKPLQANLARVAAMVQDRLTDKIAI